MLKADYSNFLAICITLWWPCTLADVLENTAFQEVYITKEICVSKNLFTNTQANGKLLRSWKSFHARNWETGPSISNVPPSIQLFFCGSEHSGQHSGPWCAPRGGQMWSWYDTHHKMQCLSAPVRQSRSACISIHWACQRYFWECSAFVLQVFIVTPYPLSWHCLGENNSSEILKISILSLSYGSEAKATLEVWSRAWGIWGQIQVLHPLMTLIRRVSQQACTIYTFLCSQIS